MINAIYIVAHTCCLVYNYIMSTVVYLLNNDRLAIDGIPPDGTPQFLITNLVGVVTIVHFILAGTIMLGVIIALGFNIIFRNRK